MKIIIKKISNRIDMNNNKLTIAIIAALVFIMTFEIMEI